MQHAPTYHAPRTGMMIRPSLPNKQSKVFSVPAFIRGFARGYSERADLVTQLLDGTDINRMWDEFQQTLNLFNRQRNALIALLTYTVTNPVERVMVPSGEDFEESTEFGEPMGIRPGVHYPVGFPFRMHDLALRFTYDYLAESTQQEVSALNNSAMEASNRLQFKKVLQAVFRNTDSTFVQNLMLVDPIKVYPFYNADGFVPPPYKTYSFAGSHTHYLVSGSATLDSGDLDDMETHLYHHGYGVATGARLVLLCNRTEGVKIRKFRVLSGDSYDFIPSPDVGGGVFIPAGTFVGRPGETVPGQIGTYGPWIVVEEDLLPAGYLFGFATGGETNLINPVGIREHDIQTMRGLKLVKGRDNDYPLIDSFYRHGLGTGIRHRGAGVVNKIATGSYTVPAAYA